jgi:hypothetical protein
MGATGAHSQLLVPADKKWYRDLFVARALVERLEHFEHEWTAALEERGRAALAALRAWTSRRLARLTRRGRAARARSGDTTSGAVGRDDDPPPARNTAGGG